MLFFFYICYNMIFNISGCGPDVVCWYSRSLVCLFLLLCDLNMQPCVSQRETNIGGAAASRAVNNTSSFSLSARYNFSKRPTVDR